MRAPRTFLRWGCAAIAMVATFPAASLNAQQTPTQDRKEHVVRNGDTLWDLARQYLANPFLWPMIFEANRQVVENPHRIFPRERLVIPPLPGEQPVVAVQDAVEVVAQPQAPTPSAQQARTRFYTQAETPTTQPTLITAANAAKRRVQPGEYYAAPFLADTLAIVGKVYKPTDARIRMDKLGHTFHPYESMYVSYSGSYTPEVGDQLLAVRIERDIMGYGHMIIPNGVVVVDSLTQTVMRATVTRQFGDLRTGDLLIPMDSFPENAAVPLALEDGPQGVVLDFVQRQPLYGTTEHAFVNLGEASGIKVGDELVAYLPQRRADNGAGRMVPPQPIATMIVIKTGLRSSTVRVTRLQEAVLDRGVPVQLVRRMP